MNPEITLSTLLVAALTLGAVHTLAPDHWLPVATLARARGWSAGRTARITLLCALGHLAATALLAMAGLWLSAEAVTRAGSHIGAVAGVFLICGGLTYGAWSWHKAITRRAETRSADRLTTLTTGGLLLFFLLDPCVALIPLLFAAAPLGASAAATVGLTYGMATVGTMLVLVVPLRHALTRWQGAFLNRWGHTLAGGIVALSGIFVMLVGI